MFAYLISSLEFCPVRPRLRPRNPRWHRRHIGDVFAADVGITGETVVALGRRLAAGKTEIDATGKLVLPGGVDAHAHIEQALRAPAS